MAVFGIGGVGGFTVEALARSGVGTLDLIDDDRVCLTNINRQIIATRKTIGQYKVDAAKERILDINPDAVVNTYKTFFMPDTADAFDFSVYDYVVDAIDTVTARLCLWRLRRRPVHRSSVQWELAINWIRQLLKWRIFIRHRYALWQMLAPGAEEKGLRKLKVVYSKEKALTPIDDTANSCRSHCICPPGSARTCTQRRQIPGSTAFVPSVVGLIIAGEVIKDLTVH